MKIQAKKTLGQNFLRDQKILDTIANFFDVHGKHILEVGPGYGALTEFLVKKNPARLHLVELDIDMIKILESRVKKGELGGEKIDLQIFHQDVLTFEPKFGEKSDYFVIANIPYYITSPILAHFLYKLTDKPRKMLILMQKEVGERILEGKIENEKGKINDFEKEKTVSSLKEDVKKLKLKKTRSSVLSLMIAKKSFVQKVCDVPKTAFDPVPKVDSIVLAFETHHQFDHISDDSFLEFIKTCFAEPRKKLQNNLLKGNFEKSEIIKAYSQLGIDENTRGEELSLEKFIELIKFLCTV